MHPNLNPKDDSQWVVYPPLSKRTARQRFIYRAAERYGLTSILKTAARNFSRVERTFHEALCTCPLPEGATSWTFSPGAEDIFIHLTMSRLEGKPLPVPLEVFAPQLSTP